MLIFKLLINCAANQLYRPLKTVLIFTCFTVKEYVNMHSVAKTTFQLELRKKNLIVIGIVCQIGYEKTCIRDVPN
jgi:hypothetical protein